MIYCLRCLYPASHPLLIEFDSQGICTGCRIHEEKEQLDWEALEAELSAILDDHRSSSGRRYDCIVAASGARDSYFIVHTLRVKHGMNPLLVSYNRHYNTAAGVHNLARLRSKLGCDILTQTLDPRLIRQIMLATLEARGSFHWHALAGHTVLPVQIAVRLKIPLIVWGVHQGCDQVGMYSHRDQVEMTRKYRKEHDLMGLEAEDLVLGCDDLDEEELLPFFYPSDEDLRRVGVRGIYLSNFMRWDTKAQHEAMLPIYDYYTGSQGRTFDTYSHVDDAHYCGLHDYLKVLKHGYGVATDHACREIRFGRLTREQGMDLVQRLTTLDAPSDLSRMLQRLQLSPEAFHAMLDRHRNPSVWQQEVDGGWTLRDSLHDHRHDPGMEAARLPSSGACDFVESTPEGFPEEATSDQLLARGWANESVHQPAPPESNP